MNKKYILLLVFMLTILVLTGCDQTISVSTLNNYFNTNKGGQDQSGANMQTSLQDSINENIAILEKVQNTLEELDLVDFETKQPWKITQLISDLKSWHSDTVNIPLRDKDGNTTEWGRALWNSIYLTAHSQAHMLSRITNSVVLDVLYLLKSSNPALCTSRGNLTFGDSSTGTANGLGTYTDVDVALTLYGFSISSLELKAMSPNGDGTYTKKGSWDLKPDMTADQNNGLYKFTYKPSNLTSDVELSFTGYDSKEKANKPESIDVRPIRDTSTINGISAEFLTKQSEKDNDGKLKYAGYNDWAMLRNVFDDDEDQDKLLHAGKGGSYSFSSYSEHASDIYYGDVFKSENGNYTISRQVGTVTGGNTSYELWVTIKFEYVCTGADDTTHMDIQQFISKKSSEATTKPFDLLPNSSWKKLDTNKSKYQIESDITVKNIHEHLMQYKDFTPISINGKKFAKLTTNKTNVNNYQLTTNKQLVFLGAGKEDSDDDQDPNASAKVDLFGKLKESDITKVKSIDLYIGCQKVGTLKLTVLNEEIANVGSAATSGLSGRSSSTSYQTCKIFCKALENDSSNRLYLLFGLYDVAVINSFTAIHDGSTDYLYFPEYTNGGFVYNIFDNNIYGINATDRSTKYGNYDNSGGVTLYSGGDVVIFADAAYNKIKNTNSAAIISNLGEMYKPLGESLAKTRTMFALRTYEEGLFLPNVYKKDLFVCLGRKVVFSDKLFDGTWLHTFTHSNNVVHSAVGQNTPLYSVRMPTDVGEYYEGSAKPITYLVSSKVYKKSLTALDPALQAQLTSDPKGLRIIEGTNISDKLFTTGTQQTTRDINKLTSNIIYAGKLKTYSGETISKQAQLFGEDETGVGQNYPPIWVWCTMFDVTTEIADYLKTVDFQNWIVWLNANGYRTYLANLDMDQLQTLLIERISATYDISFSEAEQEDTIIFDTSALEKTEDWLNDNNEKRRNAVIDTILRILGIVFIAYGILLFVCAIIDTVAIGEGDGLLKKVSFNRMKTVTGMTRAQRKELSERSEKGTYTTRAVSIMGVFPVALVLWTVAALLLIGSSYSLIDMLMDIGDGITNIFRGGIGKVD